MYRRVTNNCCKDEFLAKLVRGVQSHGRSVSLAGSALGHSDKVYSQGWWVQLNLSGWGESASTLHLIMNDGERVSHTGWSGTLQGLGTGCVGGSALYKEFMCAWWVRWVLSISTDWLLPVAALSLLGKANFTGVNLEILQKTIDFECWLVLYVLLVDAKKWDVASGQINDGWYLQCHQFVFAFCMVGKNRCNWKWNYLLILVHGYTIKI